MMQSTPANNSNTSIRDSDVLPERIENLQPGRIRGGADHIHESHNDDHHHKRKHPFLNAMKAFLSKMEENGRQYEMDDKMQRAKVKKQQIEQSDFIEERRKEIKQNVGKKKGLVTYEEIQNMKHAMLKQVSHNMKRSSAQRGGRHH